MISVQALEAWKAHAINCKDEEAVGIIVKGEFHPLKNVAEDKANTFRTDPYEVLGIIGNDGKVEALLHSHLKDHPVGPSKEDMVQQVAAAIPFGISKCDGENVTDPIWFGDQVPMRPLLGRPFIYGVWDCFSLTRDYYRMQGVEYADFPRENMWWNEPDKNYYVDSLEPAGFKVISRSEVRPGDGFLMALLTKTGVCNHSGVYLGNDLMLHHVLGKLSTRAVMGAWQEKVKLWVRHTAMPEVPKDVA